VDHQTLHHKELVIMEIPPHARVVVTEVADGDTIHVAPSIIINNTYRTVARPTDIDALEFTTPEGRWAEATTLTTVTAITTTLYTTIPVTITIPPTTTHTTTVPVTETTQTTTFTITIAATITYTTTIPSTTTTEKLRQPTRQL
jgi:hypothetical protein